jgi:hypothetical protein
MSDEERQLEKLLVLLPHWIEHNSEHAEEFRNWADGAGSAAGFLEQAAGLLEQANLSLSSALKEVRAAVERSQ